MLRLESLPIASINASVRSTALCIFALLCCVCSRAFATDYYVDGLLGIDTPTGGTATQPWKTISYAISQIPKPTGTQVHTLLVAGNQDYVIKSPIVLPDRVHIVGTGRSLPRLLGAITQPTIVADTTQAGVWFRIAHLELVGGKYGLEVSPRAVNQNVAVDHVTFTGQDACTAVFASYSSQVHFLLENCRLEQSNNGAYLAVDTTARLSAIIEQCEFSSTNLEGVICNASKTSTTTLSVETTRFEGCNRGFVVRSSDTANIQATADRCAFRRCSFGGVEATLNGTGIFGVTNSTFYQCDTGIDIDGVPSSNHNAVTIEKNWIASSTYDGIRMNIDGDPINSPLWAIQCADNRIERCEENYSLTFQTASRGTFLSSRDVSRGSNGPAMRITNNGTQMAVAVENAMLLTAARQGLYARGAGTVYAYSTTIADNQRAGIDSATTTLRFDSGILDNNATPDVSGTAVNMTYTCSSASLHPGTGNLFANPKLSRPHYKLTTGSPCIDASSSTIIYKYDYEGDLRPTTIGKLDMGADEFFTVGSTRTYGTPGFGVFDGMAPNAIPSTVTARIGYSVTLQLNGAHAESGALALAGILGIGIADRAPAVDLDPVGMSGSVLFGDVFVFLGAPVVSPGNSTLTLAIPNDTSLVDAVVGAQWLVLATATNPFGLVATEGYRMTIGR
ncbi:MAG: hypothetical protein H6833_11260 [Planctomycetes bacterium]|nr:hypothetical protein [Planctomycetota bacterium]